METSDKTVVRGRIMLTLWKTTGLYGRDCVAYNETIPGGL